MKTAQRFICLALAAALVLLSPGRDATAAFVDVNLVPDAPRPVAPQLPVLGGPTAAPILDLKTVSLDINAPLSLPQAAAASVSASASVTATAQARAATAAKPISAQAALTAGSQRLEAASSAQAPSVLDSMYMGSRFKAEGADSVSADDSKKGTPEREEELEPSRRGRDDAGPSRSSEIDRPRHPGRDEGPDSTQHPGAFAKMFAVAGVAAGAVKIAAAALTFVPLVASLVLHEMGHAKAASLLGDEAPRRAGRLSFTWAGIKSHIDRNGTIIFPLATLLLGMMPFGWAKPVQPNAHHSRAGMAFIGAAGPLVNLALLGAGLALAHGLAAAGAPAVFLEATKLFLVSNAVLAVFNLIPVFPLDGHWIARAAIPLSWAKKWDRFNDRVQSPDRPTSGKDLIRKYLPYLPLAAIVIVGNFTGIFPSLVLGLIHILPTAAAIPGVALAGAALPALAAAGLMIGQLRAAGPALLNPDKPAVVDSAADKPVDLIVMLGDRVPAKLTRDAHLSTVDVGRRGGVAQFAKLQQSMLADLSAAGISADALASYGATPIATYRRINATTLRVDSKRAAELRAALEADGHKVFDNARRKIITPVPNDPQSMDPSMRNPVTMDEVLTLTNTDAVHKIATERWGPADKKPGFWRRLFGQAPAQTPIAVIDSGAQTEHPLLKQVKKVVNVTSGENKDDIGHGSWVTSMVLNFAKWNRSLTHYKTFVDGGASTDDILKALTAAGNDGNLVISNSWGSNDGDPKGPDSQLVLQLAKEGHVLVFAAGNAGPGPNTVGSPAVMYYDAGEGALRVVAVAAAGRDKKIARFSSRGEKTPATKDDPNQQPRPDATAIGANVEGAWPQELGPDRVDARKGPQKAISGTSMSTPDLAGAISLLAMLFGVTTKGERLDAVVRAVIQTLENTGQGHANEGRGFLNVEAAYRLLEKTLGASPAGFVSRRLGLASTREIPAAILAEYRDLQEAEKYYQQRRAYLNDWTHGSRYDEDVDPKLQAKADARAPRVAELEERYPQLKGGWRSWLGTVLRGGRS